ncbi:MAG: 23S rRNA (pseudouridine(1915)-N(3))-methyltransferase RlmH [bacterium]
MKINLITIGKAMPAWINSGFFEYARRLPKDYQLVLIETPPLRRTKSTNTNIPKNTLIIALDEHGKEWTTLELARKLETWHNEQQDISLLVGGPDGLSPECLKKAQAIWSLSKLTLPHQLVKIFIAEQIYRAWSIISKHPYHRN